MSDVDNRKTIEFWRDSKHTPPWLYAATKAGKKWPQQKIVTEAEYEAAVKSTAKTPSGYRG